MWNLTLRRHTPIIGPSSARILGLCVLSCFGLVAQTHGQTPPDSEFTDRTDVVAVDIPVQVLLDGEPIRGLQVGDFEVLLGRKTQPLVGFEEVDLSLIEDSPAPTTSGSKVQSPGTVPPMDARRHFLLLFDLSFSAAESIRQAQSGALELLEQGLHPTDLVAVATYSSLSGPQLLLGFTPDRKQAALAIETLGLPQLTRPVADPLGLIFGDLETAERGFSSGRAGGLVTETLQDFARLMERQDKRRYEDRVRAMTQSMADLADLLHNAPGRKHVVFLSEGFDTSLFFGTDDTDQRQRQNQALEEGRVWEVASEDRFGSSAAQSDLEDMFRAFRRAGCRIEAVDIGGIRASTDAALGGRRATERQNTTQRGRQDGLAMMASATGGTFIRNHNDLAKAMAEMQRRTAVTYLLTIQPQHLEFDGKYHRLKVRLKTPPKGAKLVHRPGFYAPKSWEETSPGARRLITAGQVLGELSGGELSLGLTASALPVDAQDAATPGTSADSTLISPLAYVPLMVEIDGVPLLAAATQSEGILRGQLFIYAMNGAGQVKAFLDHAIGVDLDQAASALAASGLKFFGDLELPSGEYMLRAVVRLHEGERFGFAGQPLHVPDFAGGEAGTLPPLFPEPPGRWMMLRQEPIPGMPMPPFPYLNGQQPFLPSARPAFAAGPIDVALALHNLSGQGTSFNAKVLDAAGQPTRAKVRAVEPAPIDDPERPGLSRWHLALDAKKLAPGDYTFEVTITDEAGLRSVQQSSFQIILRETR